MRLVDRLGARFRASVTTVVAGAGFGKTTALAQAVRHNQLAPQGIDAWVSCGPGHENAEVLAGAILDALGSPAAPHPSAAERVLAAVVHCSPLEVAIIVDDCHYLAGTYATDSSARDSSGRGTSSERLLATLARHLPANGHLVLCGRWLPEVPLARLEAAGSVRRITTAELAFNEDEVATVSARSGHPVAQASGAGGWPALVRLALAARPGVEREYLRQEVLGELDAPHRDALVALTLLGPSTDAEVQRVLPGAAPLSELAGRLPLIAVTDAGRFSAHQLWDEPAQGAFDPPTVAELRRRAQAVLLGTGDLPRAGALAIANRDWEALGHACTALVGRSMTHLPLDTVLSWLRSVPADHGQPGIDLLIAATRFATSGLDPGVSDDLDAVITTGRRHGDLLLESRAIAMAAVVAHGRNDVSRLAPLAARATELAAEVDEPVLGLLAAAIPAIAADLRGDPDGVLAAFEAVAWRRLPAGVGHTAQRLRIQALWMAGRAAESVDVAEQEFAGSSDPFISGQGALARWFAGDPSGIALTEEARFVGTPSARDLFVTACFWTVILSSGGATARIERIWKDVPVAELAHDDARDSAHLTNARAARYVLAHDEPAAAEQFAAHLAAHPVVDTLGERHLRRWPALGYVLSEDLRRHWDAAELGPSHVMARAAARALLACRAGRPVDRAPSPAELFTQLPLPWTVELAATWRANDDPRGRELLDELLDRVPEATTAELRRLADGRDPLSRGAAGLERDLPAVPTERLEISVLGPLELRRDGRRVDAPELRRVRVRQLLMLLTVEQTVRRDRAMSLLWPDMDQTGASSNLRVTLAHLRRVLEPDRGAGATAFHLRTDAEVIRLHPSAHLTVDVWRHRELQSALQLGDGDPRDDQRLLTELVELWRGEPLADLADVGELVPERQRLRGEQVSGLIRLGELCVVTGRPAVAADCASRVLSIDPYREAAHRLAIAALTQLDDAPGVVVALDRLEAMLDDVGVEAEPETEILRRQAMARFGRVLGPVAGAPSAGIRSSGTRSAGTRSAGTRSGGARSARARSAALG
jgi:LuxR family transcriptional regulator, maltose regulon positive regulatory protein